MANVLMLPFAAVLWKHETMRKAIYEMEENMMGEEKPFP